jgi:hypothetical protein
VIAAVARQARGYRYEARAVWFTESGFCVSQALEQFDRQPLHKREPDMFATYEVNGGHVEDYNDRADAERHAGELNGDRS